jgi:hypothetical protein
VLVSPVRDEREGRKARRRGLRGKKKVNDDNEEGKKRRTDDTHILFYALLPLLLEARDSKHEAAISPPTLGRERCKEKSSTRLYHHRRRHLYTRHRHLYEDNRLYKKTKG